MIFHGSSGSPVFIYDPHGWTNIDGSISLGSRLVLVGIMSGFLKDEEEIEMKEGRVGIATLLNLGEVIKSYKIKELIKIFREKNKI